jgi:hypothetical protein
MSKVWVARWPLYGSIGHLQRRLHDSDQPIYRHDGEQFGFPSPSRLPRNRRTIWLLTSRRRVNFHPDVAETWILVDRMLLYYDEIDARRDHDAIREKENFSYPRITGLRKPYTSTRGHNVNGVHMLSPRCRKEIKKNLQPVPCANVPPRGLDAPCRSLAPSSNGPDVS